MNSYQGVRVLHEVTVEVTDSLGFTMPLSLERSLRVRSHSPTGWNWGYAGSGPRQLALGILLDASNDETFAQLLSNRFKEEHVAKWGDEWFITQLDVLRWMISALATTPGVVCD